MSILNREQRIQFFTQGYLTLPSFFSKEEMGFVKNLHNQVWEDLPDSLIVDDLHLGKRSLIGEVEQEHRENRFKFSDLYLIYPELRQEVACNARLFPLLKELMVDNPVLCNTLNLDYGSSQPLHVDALYMKPSTPFNLAAVWVALEDVHPDSGPLQFVPGSHMIEQYVFSNGDTRAIECEMPAWHRYMEEQMEQWGLSVKQFVAHAGDIFIWHAYLCHGGAAIRDHSLTRKSMVCHYFVEEDAKKFFPVVHENGGYWLDKPPLEA